MPPLLSRFLEQSSKTKVGLALAEENLFVSAAGREEMDEYFRIDG
jgi:hypothetical protein